MRYPSRLLVILLLGSLHQSICSAEEWLGKEVFWKHSAVSKDGSKAVNKLDHLDYPSIVKEVNGDWLFLGTVWTRKTDCMQAQAALDYYDKAIGIDPKNAVAYRNRR